MSGVISAPLEQGEAPFELLVVDLTAGESAPQQIERVVALASAVSLTAIGDRGSS